MNNQNLKPHYVILDGLRGVAALMVLWYHIFEAFATSPLDQVFNHGYLAVDFFFLLSGFVLSYSYDEQIKTLSIGSFIKKRIFRLHPMLLIASVLGAVMVCVQSMFSAELSAVPVAVVLLSLAMHIFLIPSSSAVDLRGYTEMFPLNGPAWSLFFEYIGSLLYVLVLRYLPKKVLMLLLLLLIGIQCYLVYTSEWGYVGSGWSLSYDQGFVGGLLRVLSAITLGVLLARVCSPAKVKNSFAITSLVLIVLLSMPRIGGGDAMWLNATYELVCIFLIFPALIYWGTSQVGVSPRLLSVCKFLGALSYPLYIIHYPFIYLYILWVKANNYTFVDSIWGALGLYVGVIALAYMLLQCYDKPVRKLLSKL